MVDLVKFVKSVKLVLAITEPIAIGGKRERGVREET